MKTIYLRLDIWNTWYDIFCLCQFIADFKRTCSKFIIFLIPRVSGLLCFLVIILKLLIFVPNKYYTTWKLTFSLKIILQIWSWSLFSYKYYIFKNYAFWKTREALYRFKKKLNTDPVFGRFLFPFFGLFLKRVLCVKYKLRTLFVLVCFYSYFFY